MLKKIVQKENFAYLLLFFFVLSVGSLLYTHIGREVIFNGDDAFFHVIRIEGIAEGIQNGDWFPRINYFFLLGMGYASPIFYSDIFLYPAGVLRALGLPMSTNFILYLIAISFTTYLIAYYSFLYYKKERVQAFIFAVIYGTSSYRLSDLTERAAIGELLALMFLPVALIGLWTILHQNNHKFYLLSLGMTGLILSHVLSGLIFTLFMFFYLLVQVKIFFREKKIFLEFSKAIGLTILFCLGFLVPIIEQIVDQRFYFQDNQVAKMSETAGTITGYMEPILQNSGYNNLGIFTLILLILLIMKFKKINSFSKQLVVSSGVLLFLSTNLFPYRFFDDTFINSIQFPWRFFSLVTLFVCWAFADNIMVLFKKEHYTVFLFYGSLLVVVVLLVVHNLNLYVPERYMTKQSFNSITGIYIGWGSEYLPAEMNMYQLINDHENVTSSREIEVTNIQFDYGRISLNYATGDKETVGTIIFPFVYYKGYQATIDDQSVLVSKSDNLPGLSEVQVKGSGRLTISYQWTVIQVWSAVISVATLLIFVGFLLIEKAKKGSYKILSFWQGKS